jgi:hypothetical protein
MKVITSVCLIVLVTTSRLCSAQGLSPDKSLFIVRIKTESGTWKSSESSIVPYLPGRSCFQWRLHLTGDDTAQFVLKQIYTMSARPEQWTTNRPMLLTNERKSATTIERLMLPSDGWITRGWCVAKGDPLGRHIIDVYLNNFLSKRFTFQLR